MSTTCMQNFVKIGKVVSESIKDKLDGLTDRQTNIYTNTDDFLYLIV